MFDWIKAALISPNSLAEKMKAWFFLLFLLCSNLLFAQDTLKLKSGDDLVVTLMQISPQFIEYISWDDSLKITTAIHKREVIEIRYLNGKVDFIQYQEDVQQYSMQDSAYYKSIGKSDADASYKKYRKGAGFSAGTTLLFTPLIGFIPTYKMLKKAPKSHHLDFPDSTLLGNPIYEDAYKDEAFRIKKEKVKIAYGVSSFSWFLLLAWIVNYQAPLDK